MPGAALRAWTSFLLLLALALLTATAAAQGPAGQDPQLSATTVTALERLAKEIESKRAERDKAATGDDAELLDRVDGELRELSQQFAALAARIDVAQFEQTTPRQFDLRSEVESLLRPLLQTIKDATAGPRQAAALRTQAERTEERLANAKAAKRTTIRTRNLLPEGSLARREATREIDDRWTTMIDVLEGQILVLEAQIDNQQADQQTLLDRISDSSHEFLKSSGLNLLLCGLVFFAVLFGMRWLQNLALSRRQKHRAVSVRVLEVVLATLSLLLAIAATMIVPYVRNDWLLLAIGIVFLVGAGWVLVRMLPQFFEQIRLVLNIGAVREGERLVVDGLPYRVESLSFYSQLTNPDLQGGTLRMPIQELIGRRSRQADPDEPWFPCRKGDYVTLADGVFGPVSTQTPEFVLVQDYAAPRTYPTAAFLAAKPRNLSRGFGLIRTFRIDYRHQKEATTTIPDVLGQALRTGLEAMVPAAQIRHVHVQLEAANQSSLDYEARADFDGAAAAHYLELQRALQRILVDACTTNDWIIPFPQLTVHKADGPVTVRGTR